MPQTVSNEVDSASHGIRMNLSSLIAMERCAFVTYFRDIIILVEQKFKKTPFLVQTCLFTNIFLPCTLTLRTLLALSTSLPQRDVRWQGRHQEWKV